MADDIELQIKQLQNKLKEIKKPEKVLKNLVLSGGSTKGFSYIGVIKCLDEFSLLDNLEEIVGTSIGALFSTFVCLKSCSAFFKSVPSGAVNKFSLVIIELTWAL